MNKPEQLTQWANNLKPDPDEAVRDALEALQAALATYYGLTEAVIYIAPSGAIIRGAS